MKRVKKNNRTIPLFLIDRSKPDTFPYDFFVCADYAYPFMGRFVYFDTKEELQQYKEEQSRLFDHPVMADTPFHRGYLIAVGESFLADVEWNESIQRRLESLVEKVLMKYKFNR